MYEQFFHIFIFKALGTWSSCWYVVGERVLEGRWLGSIFSESSQNLPGMPEEILPLGWSATRIDLRPSRIVVNTLLLSHGYSLFVRISDGLVYCINLLKCSIQCISQNFKEIIATNPPQACNHRCGYPNEPLQLQSCIVSMR